MDYPGNNTFPASAELPDDSDDIDAASVNVGLTAALDRTTYLYNRGVRGLARRQDGTEISGYTHTFTAVSWAAATPPEMSVSLTDIGHNDVILVWASLLAKINNPGSGFLTIWLDVVGAVSTDITTQKVEFNSQYGLSGAYVIDTVGLSGSTATANIRGRVLAAPTTIDVVGPVQISMLHLRGNQ